VGQNPGGKMRDQGLHVFIVFKILYGLLHVFLTLAFPRRRGGLPRQGTSADPHLYLVPELSFQYLGNASALLLVMERALLLIKYQLQHSAVKGLRQTVEKKVACDAGDAELLHRPYPVLDVGDG